MESRLLKDEEIREAVKGLPYADLIELNNPKWQRVIQAQDTKSVKARDKEWVEWLEDYVSDMTGILGNPEGNKFVIIGQRVWEALKRGIDEQS